MLSQCGCSEHSLGDSTACRDPASDGLSPVHKSARCTFTPPPSTSPLPSMTEPQVPITSAAHPAPTAPTTAPMVDASSAMPAPPYAATQPTPRPAGMFAQVQQAIGQAIPPSQTMVAHQPGPVPQMSLDAGGMQRDANGEREWKHGLFGCFGDIGTCAPSSHLMRRNVGTDAI